MFVPTNGFLTNFGSDFERNMLYPLKFIPALKEVVWGGERLVRAGKPAPKGLDPKHIGESWEISGLEEGESVVAFGALADNTLAELTEVYMGELVGEKVYEKYGLEFPVLVKIIDTRERLSVQVHPTDEFAEQMHSSRGKLEMWYVIDAAPDGAIYLDVAHPMTEEEYDQAVEDGTIASYLRRRVVHKGDAFVVPEGTIHSIGAGVLLAEIQEPSNITYRIYDWGRVDSLGHPRELHTALAAEVASLIPAENLEITHPSRRNEAVELYSCERFTTNLLEIDGTVEMDFAPLDSFVAYLCVEGEVVIRSMGESESLGELQTLLIPAEATDVTIGGRGKLLEIFVR